LLIQAPKLPHSPLVPVPIMKIPCRCSSPEKTSKSTTGLLVTSVTAIAKVAGSMKMSTSAAVAEVSGPPLMVYKAGSTVRSASSSKPPSESLCVYWKSDTPKVEPE
jgi:hypothetical protein